MAFIFSKPLILWLISCCAMVLLMVWIGGFTRLTKSGLSITEWKPIVGIAPPIGEEMWMIEKKKYEKTPEFQKINGDITLPEFKKIYLIEYFHRLFARVTGLVFLLPFIYFLIKKQLSAALIIRLATVLVLGVMQGFMGWYMVASGLVDIPHVSPYRLVMHLLLALLIFSLLWQQAVFCMFNNKKSKISLFFVLIVLQIFYGGLVAGLNAGLIYNTFPLMGDSLFPDNLFYYKPLYVNFFENPIMVQFVHRILALIIFTYALCLVYLYRGAAWLLILCTLVQIVLGISTLILQVPLVLASAHQVFAFILVAVSLYCTGSNYGKTSFI